jgi:predicted secreted protein
MFFEAMAFALLLAQAPPIPSPPQVPDQTPLPCMPPLADDAGSENMRGIVASAGQLFVVFLRSTPGTGYAWVLSKPPDAAIATSLGRAVTPAPLQGSGQPSVGAANQEVWLFSARATGTTAFTFTYARPWEHVPPAKSVQIELDVNPAGVPCMRRMRPDAG